MARYTKAHAAERAELQKKIARLEAQLRPLRERESALHYGEMHKVAPETFIAQKRAPLEKLLPAFVKSTNSLVDAGFKLDRTYYAHTTPNFEDPTVWRHSDFFGAQKFVLNIPKTFACIEVVFDVPMGNSKGKNEDYLAYDIHLGTQGNRDYTKTKLTETQWNTLSDLMTWGIEFKSFKGFHARLTKMLNAVAAL